ncbi:hypothetical protein LXL04_035995 [Taraxacum kok-saghyz]
MCTHGLPSWHLRLSHFIVPQKKSCPETPYLSLLSVSGSKKPYLSASPSSQSIFHMSEISIPPPFFLETLPPPSSKISVSQPSPPSYHYTTSPATYRLSTDSRSASTPHNH